MTNEEVARLFLKKNRKYASFKRQRVDDELTRTANLNNWIFKSMFVDESPEGRPYWLTKHNEWLELMNHFNLNGPLDAMKI